MADIIIAVVGAIIAALGTLITRYAVPWIQARMDTEALGSAQTVISAVVTAAYGEGIKKGWSGDSQKAWAIAKAKEFGLDLTGAQYDVLRKAVVAEVKGLLISPEIKRE
jgi:hypothetical protein